MKLSVVIPAYNEIGTIAEIISRVRAVPVDKEIIVIDNCSTDGTREAIGALDFPELRVILQERNMMKGNSVKKGFAAALGEFVIIQDADLEYDPMDYLPLLETIQQPGVHAVLGSRTLGLRRSGQRLPHSVFNVGRAAITLWFRLLFGVGLTDVATCYKLARRETFQGMRLRCESFDLDFELSAKLVKGARRTGMRVVEVPVHYNPRTAQQGKKIGWRDGLAALWTILKFRLVD
jgi:glycosyltransferase involved in cell wall biosynthesis